MNSERFTEKAREAINQAVELAREQHNSQVESVHLLTALLNQEGGVVPQIIQKVGGNLAEAKRLVASELERLPHVYGGSDPGLSQQMRRVLEDAWHEMSNFKDDY